MNKTWSRHLNKIPLNLAPVAFVFLCVLGSLYWHLYAGKVPSLNLTSIDYVQFSLRRVFGYPLLVQLVEYFTGTYTTIPALQLIGVLLATGYLVIQFHRLTRAYLWSLGLLLLVAGNLLALKYCFIVMPQAVNLGLLILALGLLCQFAVDKQLKYIGYFSLTIGLSVIVRPAYYAFVSCLLLLFFLARVYFPTFNIRNLAIALLPLTLCVLAGATWHYTFTGMFKTQSFTGEVLIGKAGMIVDNSVQSTHPDTVSAMSNMAEKIRTLVNKGPDLHTQFLLSSEFYDAFKYEPPYAHRIIKALVKYAAPPTTYVELDQMRMALALEIIQQRPMAYLKNVWMSYMALWQLWSLMTPDEGARFDRLVADNQPVLFLSQSWVTENIKNAQFGDYDAIVYTQSPMQWIIVPMRALFAYVWLITVLVFIHVLISWKNRQPLSDVAWVTCLASTLVQSVFLLTAFLNSSSLAYTLAMWPAIAFIAIISVFWLKEKPFFHRR